MKYYKYNFNLSKFSKIKKDLIFFMIYFCIFSLLLLPIWLNKKFGLIYFDQFKFNLTLLYYGYLDGDSNVVNSAIKWFIIIPIFLSIIFFYIKKLISFFYINKDNSIEIIIKKLKSIKKNYFKFKIYKFILLINFFVNKIFLLIISVIIFILFYSFTNFFKKPLKVSNLDYLDLNYEYPSVYSEGKNKNLVLLYVESLEKTWSNQNIFNEDLIKEISDIKEGKSVKYFDQIPALGYTFSSLVSTQCGIPLLKISNSYMDSKDLKGINKFLPNLTCLSDILADHNYENIFLSSDYLENSLTDIFLLTHNYSQLFGLNELTNMGYKTSKNAYHNKNKWSGGIHDNVLLKASIDILKKQKNNNKNFFMTIMTLDTHSPAGTPNQECLKKISDQRNLNRYTFKESFKCTSRYVSEFVKEFNNLNFENTQLIILGDHLLMKNLGDIVNINERYIFNKFFIDGALEIKRDHINFFDFYPSILEIMNFKIKNKKGKVALGYSIFKKNDDYKVISSHMRGRSKLYDTFWQISTK